MNNLIIAGIANIVVITVLMVGLIYIVKYITMEVKSAKEAINSMNEKLSDSSAELNKDEDDDDEVAWSFSDFYSRWMDMNNRINQLDGRMNEIEESYDDTATEIRKNNRNELNKIINPLYKLEGRVAIREKFEWDMIGKFFAEFFNSNKLYAVKNLETDKFVIIAPSEKSARDWLNTYISSTFCEQDAVKEMSKFEIKFVDYLDDYPDKKPDIEFEE